MKRHILISAATLSLIAAPVMAAIPGASPVFPGIETSAQAAQYGARHDHRDGDRNVRHHRHDDRDGRYAYDRNDRRDYDHRCKRDNGTGGLLVGAAVGGVIGHEVAGSGDKTAGTLIGAAGGGLIGKNIDDGYKCR